MNNYNERDEKKGGFWSALSGLFRGGSSAMGGASSGLGSAGGGLGGLFATKAGILGMVLGGATIAAGVGVVYNFIGPSSKPVYSPELFQNSYYEEESSKAGFERAQARNTAASEPSTLDMFREQAKKDGLGGLASEASDQDKAAASAGAPADGASADSAAPGAPGSDASGYGAGAGSGGPKLQAGSGFGGKGGSGSGTSMPKMQGNGGMSGGIGSQFQSVYRPPAQANGGKTSAMSASAGRISGSPKYAVPVSKGKGAYGQAKFAGKMGARAAYSADGSSARSDATSAFTGETTGSGDVGAAGTGAGLGGAGVSNGSALKGNDPSLNANTSTPPAVPTPKKENPWQATEDGIMNAMMWAGGLILLTKLLSGIAKKLPGPWALGFYIAAMVAAAAAIVFAIKVIIGGFTMFSKYGQKMMGGIYILAGVVLIMKALEALCEAAGGAGSAGSSPATAASSTTDAAGHTVLTPEKAAVDPILGKGNFLQGMGGWASAFDLGSLLK